MSREFYKRYRPRSLEQVAGNASTVEALSSYLEKDFPHTVLFDGPSGCGKTTLARICAKKLGCSGLDLAELNCSSFRGIDTVRDIERTMHLSPTGGDSRAWVLDEVHQMSRDGQNAMLKMLEDTPGHVYFFLCTTDPQKLLPTIRTRATRFTVTLLRDSEMEELVSRVAKKEGLKLKEQVLLNLVQHAAGSARAALVLLDKVSRLNPKAQMDAIKTAAEQENESIELCRALIKGATWQQVAKILRGLKKGEGESIRRDVLGYARACLINGQTNPRAFMILEVFEDDFFASGDAGLTRACYEVVVGSR